MPLFKWHEDYSVGVKKIDDEHKRLVEMLNTAFFAIQDMREQEALPELVDDMRAYAMHHFATEEMFMKHYHYPEAEAHIMKHNDFMVYVATADNALTTVRNLTLDPAKVFKYIADWLREHIMETDKELGRFLVEKGVS
ncbi:MAG: hemerythrin family protein [Proteobacteria bacterium]|nr:hemerythrin family protein [Pseudomonadota bacterium]MBU1612692.1 hemerythrin family protein [Pseudomonadota bacterium]